MRTIAIGTLSRILCASGDTTVLYRTLLCAAGVLLVAVPAAAQPKTREFGQLGVVSEHGEWPSPEAVVRDLRSPDVNIRLKALALAGVSEGLRHRAVYSTSGSPATMIGYEVVRPTQVALRYAALGTDEAQQAILAVQVGQYGFATVATQKGNAWERVASAACWAYRSHTWRSKGVGSIRDLTDPLPAGFSWKAAPNCRRTAFREWELK
jgi:hypothetical protein